MENKRKFYMLLELLMCPWPNYFKAAPSPLCLSQSVSTCCGEWPQEIHSTVMHLA